MKSNRAATSGVILATLLTCYLTKVQAYVYLGRIGAWASGSNITFQVNLGTPSHALTDGNASWDVAAAPALTAWDGVVGRVRMNGSINPSTGGSFGNGINEITWSNTAFGASWGRYTLAVTQCRSNGSNITESDVEFNPNQNWDSYRGTLRFGSNGYAIGDIQRTLIHELGHGIGLDHPDQHSQNVDAIMNSITSDRDALSRDDVAGGQSLYGAPSTTATPTPTPTATPISTPPPTPTPDPTATPVPTPTPVALPSVRVVAGPTQITEGGTATFTITTSVPSETPLTVSYSMSGTATMNVYYTLDASGQVTIPAGSTSVTVTLRALSNPKRKGSEVATMSLAAGSDYTLGSTPKASVTIKNIRNPATRASTMPTPDGTEPAGTDASETDDEGQTNGQ